MSWEPLVCSKCEVEAEFERVGQLTPPTSVGVSWLCRSCGARLLDVVFLGVDVPVPGACLNCGAAVDAEGQCGECGVPRPWLVAAIHEHCGDPPDIIAAEQLAERGLLRLACNAIDLRLESHAHEPESWLAKAEIFRHAGLTSRMILPLERALALGATLDTWISLGVTLAQSDQHERAVAAFATYLDSAPGGAHRSFAWSRRARSLRVLGRDAEAEQLLARALAEDPDDLQARVDLYTILHGQRRHAEALAQLDRALPRLDFDIRISLLPARAELLCELDRETEALKTVEEALEHTPDNPRALYNHGRALALLGKLERARASLARVLEFEPDNPAAKRAIAQIDAALHGR
ncbi:MAG TPA: tetratricopeptide repeat protein [Enhygromyxa sp.]|nr:tetratricopeptide repeat protein [Enhygromyxa sp.]